VNDDDQVFRALADPTRRKLLDRLFERDGRTLSDLESDAGMTRFGVMKHLRLLEEAGLVTTRRSGREKLHFLNVVPIRLIHDRWIDKYTESQAAALADLKTALEKTMPDTSTTTTVQVHRVWIRATAEAIWTAITDPAWNGRYGYRVPAHFDLRPGGSYRAVAEAETPGMPAGTCMVEGEVAEADPPHRLVQTWRPTWLDEPVTRLTWEITEAGEGVCALTLTHDVHNAPQTAAQVAGEMDGGGGGCPPVLSDLKSLLEAGSRLFT